MQPERVLSALKRYVRAEQKDQRHTLRHYQHVAAADPEKAEQMKFQVTTPSSLPSFLQPHAHLGLFSAITSLMGIDNGT